MNKLNNWVSKKLSEYDWSISELGRKAEINQSTISKVLSGKRNPGLDFYVKVARAFGKETLPEMLYCAGLLPVRMIGEDKNHGLLWGINQLNDEDRKVVIDFIDFLRYRHTIEKLTSEEKEDFFKFADFLLLKRDMKEMDTS